MSKSNLNGILMATLLTIVGGVIIGVIVGYVAQIFYLIILYPILICIAGFVVISSAVSVGRVRGGFAGWTLGLLLGLIICVTYRYADYAFARQAFSQQFRGQNIDTLLERETQKTGVVGYLILTARDGQEIRVHGTPITLPEPITWAYWILEATFIVGVMGWAGNSIATAPYCVKDKKYFKKFPVGRVPSNLIDLFISVVQGNDWSQATTMIDRTGDAMAYPNLLVEVDKCPVCNTNPVLLEAIYRPSPEKNRQKTRLKITVSPDQYRRLTNESGVPDDLRNQFGAARNFIAQRNFPAARQILTKINNPKAMEWLQKLDEIERG